uniref:Uncharacterized protein n=1 Tax=Moniliophthora roreri TaxID=221103 RepID=A0A0W0FD83_MONRR
MSVIPSETVVAVAGIIFYVLMLQSTLGYCSTNEQPSMALSGNPTSHRIPLRQASISQQDINLSLPPDASNLRPMVIHITKRESQAKEPDTSV